MLVILVASEFLLELNVVYSWVKPVLLPLHGRRACLHDFPLTARAAVGSVRGLPEFCNLRDAISHRGETVKLF